jgi:hypothetical protein
VPDCLDPLSEKGLGLAEGFVVVGFDADEECRIGRIERAGAPGKGDNSVNVGSVDVKYRWRAGVAGGGGVVTRTLWQVVEVVA